MLRVMLKAKIHRAILTATELHYEGQVGDTLTILTCAVNKRDCLT